MRTMGAFQHDSFAPFLIQEGQRNSGRKRALIVNRLNWSTHPQIIRSRYSRAMANIQEVYDPRGTNAWPLQPPADKKNNKYM